MVGSRVRRRVAALITVLFSVGLFSGIGANPAYADVTAVSGSAFGYYVSSCFDFGTGCGPVQVAGPEPAVTLPSTGGSETVTVPSAEVFVGPARFFKSGPITAYTEGTPGPAGSSTSSVSITGDPNGPDPFHYATVHSTCTSSEAGTTGTTTLTGGVLYLGNDRFVTIPDDPAPNTEYFGTIDGVPDSFRIVVNEQVLTSDSITVNAMHMYMLGQIAHGEVIVGQSHCDVVATSANEGQVLAVDDAYSTDSFRLEEPAPGVLGNDGDTDGDPLTAQLQSAPANGTATVGADGSFVYVPTTGFSGTDSFTYLARDARGANATATVTITVEAPPLALDNDNFVDAKVISGPSGAVQGTTLGATSEDGEFGHGNSSSASSIWYEWTAPDDLEVTVDTCHALAEFVYGAFDVYIGDSLDTLTLAASSFDNNADPDDPNQCRTTFPASSGTEYRIALVSANPGFDGPVVLDWTSVPVTRPANDDLADAQVISGRSGSVTGSNVNATQEPGVPDYGYAGFSDVSIWYDWTAPADGEVTFNTCASRNEANTENGGWLDTILAVYTGSLVDALTEVALNDDDEAELCGGGRLYVVGSRVTFMATAGTTYHVAVDGAGYPVRPTGDVVLEWRMATGNEPTARDDRLVVLNDTAGGNVLANDSDPNGDTISLTAHTPANSGTVICQPTGECTYTVKPELVGFKLSDSFKYTVTDSTGESTVGTVSLSINLPVAGDDAYSTTPDTPLVVGAPGVLANDADPFGAPLTANYASDPAGGSVVLDPDGSFTYTPDSGFTGTDTFVYLALTPEGSGSLPTTVTITVAPPAVSPTTLTCTPGTTGAGAPIEVCTVRDGDGVRIVRVVDTAARANAIAPLSFSCSSAPTSVEFRVPANTRYRVSVTDCNRPRNRSTFTIRANGKVRQVSPAIA